MSDDADAATVIDATGLFCPEPVMMLHAAVRKIAAGDTVRLVATDPSTQRDVPNFCRFLEHELIEEQARDGQYEYLIKKSGA